MATPEPAPDISILIVSWNTCVLTRACLDTIPASVERGARVETIVVDNASSDGSVEMLRDRDDIQLVENDRNLGFAAAVNQAFVRARAPLVLLLNSDVELPPASLSALQRFMLERPSVAGVGPLYLNPDGSAQQHHYRLPTFGMTLASSSSLARRLPWLRGALRRYEMRDDDFSSPRPVPQPSASCLLLRRSALSGGALLDERFPIYFNDVELAHRLAKRGAELWVTPEVAVIHAHGASTRLLGGRLKRQHLASLVRYLELSEPRRHLLVFRTLIFLQKLVLLALRRPGAMPLRDLVAALRGDPGPLPQRPSV